MTSLALLFLVRGEGESYGAAGLVVAVYAVALGIGAPIGGRQVDRYGPTVVLQIRVVLFVAFLAAVIVLAVAGAGIAAIAGAAALAGLSMPPLSSTVRIVWPRLARDELRSTAYALEAALQEVHFVGGPLVAAALAAIEPVAALAGAGVASLIGTTMVARLPPVRETPPSRAVGAGLLGALGSAGVRTVVSYATIVGFAFGAVELAMPALAEEHGARELGGVALACFAAGSLVGGLLAGLRPGRSDLRRFIAGAFVLSGAMLTLQLAVSIPTLCLLAFVAGLPIAPTIGALYTLIDRTARTGTVAEAFAWFGPRYRSVSRPGRPSAGRSSTNAASAGRSGWGPWWRSSARCSAGRAGAHCAVRRLANPGDAVPLRRACVCLGPDRAVALGFGELAEEPLEARRRDERQEAARPRNDPPVRMRDASRREHDRARADVERGAPDGELVLALQHDEQLVLVRVDV